MTKAELVYLVLQRVNGSRTTEDSRVRAEDVSTYIAAAINWSLLKQYYTNIQLEGDHIFPEDFIATFENVEVKYNSDRDLSYIDLPVKLLSISKNRGLRSISAMKGATDFVQTSASSRQHDSYYRGSLKDSSLYWIEGDRVYFTNLPDIVKKVLVRLIQSFSDLAMDAEVPVPGGLEVDIIDVASQFFSGQRAMPTDTRPNNQDVNFSK